MSVGPTIRAQKGVHIKHEQNLIHIHTSNNVSKKGKKFQIIYIYKKNLVGYEAVKRADGTRF